jgi:hypothetical protein
MTISVSPKGIQSATMTVQKQIELPDVPMPRVAPKNTTGVTRIVVPGGIGDVYWCMVKMEAFCRSKGLQRSHKLCCCQNRKCGNLLETGLSLF